MDVTRGGGGVDEVGEEHAPARAAATTRKASVRTDTVGGRNTKAGRPFMGSLGSSE
jgi:hypothetical protein